MFGLRYMDADIPTTCADVAALYLDGEDVLDRAVWAFAPAVPKQPAPGVVKVVALDDKGRVKIAANGEPVMVKRAGLVYWTRKGE